MREIDRPRLIRFCLAVAAAIAAFFLLLPITLPILLGVGIAALLQRPIGFFREKLRLSHALAAFLCTLLLFVLIFGLCFFFCKTICTEVGAFLRQLPALASSLSEPVSALKGRLLSLCSKFPDGIGSGLRSGVEEFFKTGAGLPEKLYSGLFRIASNFLKNLPNTVLFSVTAILSSFMAAQELPKLKMFLRQKLPAPYFQKLSPLAAHFRAAFGGWLVAELKLMGCMFLILTLGLMLLGDEYPFLFAFITALVDALPVFGSGVVLLPWGLICILRHETNKGIGLFILYGVAELSRQALEPRLVGKQIGLSPLFTLAAIYAGFRLFGVAGMILFPIGVMLLRQMYAYFLHPDMAQKSRREGRGGKDISPDR